MTKLKVGDKAPNFSLPDQNGLKHSMKQYQGNWVLIYFYPKDETRGCTAQACSFRDNYEAFTDLGAEVIGISSDDVDSHQAFSSHHQLPFILLSDPNQKVRTLYGVPSTLGLLPGRVTYIIGKNGIIRHIFSSQFRPRKHITEAIEVLKNLETTESAVDL